MRKQWHSQGFPDAGLQQPHAVGEDLPEEGEESRKLQGGAVDNFLGTTFWEQFPPMSYVEA